MCQISSLMAAAEGLVAEFSSFASLEEKKRKSNLLMSFPKIGNQMGSFGQIRKKSFFRFCRPILDIFGLTLLSVAKMASTIYETDNCCAELTVFNRCKNLFLCLHKNTTSDYSFSI